jgi:hypothetical protein
MALRARSRKEARADLTLRPARAETRMAWDFESDLFSLDERC